MERPFDDAAMLHFIRDSLFRSDSPLHHEFSTSLEKFIAERIASRESEWFPCLSRDLHSCSQKLADTQAKVIELEQRVDVLQATAASATAATEQRVDALQATAASATAATGQRIDTLQSSTENATQAAANELRRVELELSQCYALLNEFVRTSSPPPPNNIQFPQPQQQQFPQPPSSSNSNQPHPPQQPLPQRPTFEPLPQFVVQRAPSQEILGRRVERLKNWSRGSRVNLDVENFEHGKKVYYDPSLCRTSPHPSIRQQRCHSSSMVMPLSTIIA